MPNWIIAVNVTKEGLCNDNYDNDNHDDNDDNAETTVTYVKLAANVNVDAIAKVALNVVNVKIREKRLKSNNVTALLDQGSQRTFIKHSYINGMKEQKGDPINLKLSVFFFYQIKGPSCTTLCI